MGHLVNARSFRLGWNMIGPDIWYKPHYDYASFIFLCARQRAVLRMLFYSKVMDKSPYIFSHFEMEKVCRHFFIKIYFYFIPFEGLMERLYRGVWKTMRRWKRKFYRYPRSHMSGMFISDRYRNWWNKKNININIGDLRRQKKKMFYYLLKYLKRARLKRRKLIFFKRNLYDVMDKPKSDNVYEDSTYLAFSRNNELLYKNLLPNYNKVVNKKASSLARIGDFHFYDKLEKREMPRCIWLFFEKGHTDISIISRVKLNLEPKLTYGNDVAWTLLKILNARERKIDSIVDDVKRPTNKFSFSCWEFVDALLENFYDTMRLNRVQRNIRKFKFNIKDLILALLVGIKHQSLIFKVWHSRQRSWYKKLDRRTKVYINRIYFDNWKTFKLERRILNKYNMMSFKKSKKKNAFKRYKRRYPEFYKYRRYNNKLFCFMFACALAACGFKKRTFYDMVHFRVLAFAFRHRKIKLLRKFFLLRTRFEGQAMFRSNMRQFFILSLFLKGMPRKARYNPNSRSYQRAFGSKLSAFIRMNLLVRVLKPIALIFNYRIYSLTKYIIKQAFTINFFLITNDEVNATFLSRYIAKKLDYHHRLKSILNPLKREFKHVGFNTALNQSLNTNFLKKKKRINTIKNFWRLILVMLFSYYNKSLQTYYNTSNIWISLDYFILMSWINKDLYNNNMKKQIKLFKLLNSRRAAFIYFFMQESSNIASTLYQVISSIRICGFNTFNNWNKLLNFMIYDLFVSKYSLLINKYSINNAQFNNIIKLGIFQFKRFLNFNYNSFCYSTFVNNTSLNI